MKRFFFVSFLLVLGVGIQLHASQKCCETTISKSNSSVPMVYLAPVTYDMNLPEFHCEITLPLNGDEELFNFNIPIASNVSVHGSNISFIISQEMFDLHIYRKYKDQGYFDLEIPVYIRYEGSGVNFPYMTRIFVLRILWTNDD